MSELAPARTILVVDDDSEALQAVGEMIGSLGHLALLCPNAPDALERLRAEKADLLLVDYRMPELTGIDLITLLREEGSALPVVLMSGYAATVDRVSTEALGIFEVLKKPVLLSQLARTIEDCLATEPGRRRP
jgi:CheY-like chemotaxis protein